VTQALVVCADDFAYSESICDAIVDLASRGRISAISCMVTSPLWRTQAARLKPLRGTVDIGLHLVLIEEAPLTSMPHTAPDGVLPALGGLMADSYGRKLALDEIQGEIAAQVAAFVAATGFAPAHIDGHRHTHVFPGIRRLVLGAAAALSPRPWVRNIAEPMGPVIARRVAVAKTLLLSALGSGLRGAARDVGVPTNAGFSGVYSLAPEENYPALFARFVEGAGAGHVIMCHPGAADATPLGATRAKEYAYLSGDEYPALLRHHGFHVGRLA
jgi:predicted glycoside hydrolase/deacetylase ChbG (UPF0249 family)